MTSTSVSGMPRSTSFHTEPALVPNFGADCGRRAFPLPASTPASIGCRSGDSSMTARSLRPSSATASSTNRKGKPLCRPNSEPRESTENSPPSRSTEYSKSRKQATCHSHARSPESGWRGRTRPFSVHSWRIDPHRNVTKPEEDSWATCRGEASAEIPSEPAWRLPPTQLVRGSTETGHDASTATPSISPPILSTSCLHGRRY